MSRTLSETEVPFHSKLRSELREAQSTLLDTPSHYFCTVEHKSHRAYLHRLARIVIALGVNYDANRLQYKCKDDPVAPCKTQLLPIILRCISCLT